MRVQRTQRLSRTVGEISFELLGDGATCALLAQWQPAPARPLEGTPLAHVLCAVGLDASLAAADGGSRPRCEQLPDGRWSIVARGLCVELERTAPDRYAVSARIAPERSAVAALMSELAAAVLRERERGRSG